MSLSDIIQIFDPFIDMIEQFTVNDPVYDSIKLIKEELIKMKGDEDAEKTMAI